MDLVGIVDLPDPIDPYIILGSLARQSLGALRIPSSWPSSLTPTICMPISTPPHFYAGPAAFAQRHDRVAGPRTPPPSLHTLPHTCMQALQQVRSVMIGQLAPIRLARACRLISQLPRLTKLRLMDLSLLRLQYEVGILAGHSQHTWGGQS